MTSNQAEDEDRVPADNPDPTMRKPPGKPSGEVVPPAGGESMAPADSGQPFAPPGGLDNERARS